jgi:hypothetical protein
MYTLRENIHGNEWFITIEVWTIYNSKINVIFFVIKSGRKLPIGVKFELNFKNEAEKDERLC